MIRRYLLSISHSVYSIDISVISSPTAAKTRHSKLLHRNIEKTSRNCQKQLCKNSGKPSGLTATKWMLNQEKKGNSKMAQCKRGVWSKAELQTPWLRGGVPQCRAQLQRLRGVFCCVFVCVCVCVCVFVLCLVPHVQRDLCQGASWTWAEEQIQWLHMTWNAAFVK